jgi:plasmid stabilization system protein ParE
MARASISFAESAVRDLEEMREWNVSQGTSEVGERLVVEVIAAVEQLVQFPESGRIVPEFDTPQLRELVRPPFRIVYRLDGDRVRIVRVWRSERLLQMP